MVKRVSKFKRRTLSADKIHELLMGKIRYSMPGYYHGYGDPYAVRTDGSGLFSPLEPYISDEMRQDWEENREGLMAFWRTGKWASDSMAEWGFNVRVPPHVWIQGERGTLPWAAKQFDKKRAAARCK